MEQQETTEVEVEVDTEMTQEGIQGTLEGGTSHLEDHPHPLEER